MNLIQASLLKAKWRFLKLFLSQSRLKALANIREPAEEPNCYKPGGFHPVSLGDTFCHDQYSILRKLGFGLYSTVWLARDLKCQRYVALKILRADSYGGAHDLFETEILSKISEVSKKSSHQGRSHVMHLLDRFKHKGPNGEHVCLVFDVLGHNLNFQTCKFEDERLPVKSVKLIAKQLLLGLDFLHRECGVIHTDLKQSNILLELENPENTISQYLSEVPPRTADPERGTPRYEVITTPSITEMKDPHLRIIDFGVSSWRDRHLSDRIQPEALRAPEVIIGAPWDTGVDIWSLGCLILEFIQGIVIFRAEASKRGTWTAEDDHLAKIMEIIGPFPRSFINKGRRAAEFFDEQGNLLRIQDLGPTSLERLLNGEHKPFLRHKDMQDHEVYVFIDFLKGMLTIDPASRKSAEELLRHEWIQS